MKKRIKKISIVGAMALALTIFFGNNVYANEYKAVLKYFKLDLNKFTMVQNYFDHQYISVPDTSAYYSQSKTIIADEWNYTRYQFTNYYKNHSDVI